ncbi:aminoglycoside phosphotransferase [Streptomyces sp. NPDC087270]|uniref:aminoglycoside phosphotransferase n=1 Tax=Streptomyces sp. NPDC087270 TaxID=3365774 RepID=UPI00381E162A
MHSADHRRTDPASGEEGAGAVLDAGDGRTVVTSPPPSVLGDGPVSVESLRHNKVNAAVFGIWRVRGPRRSAVVKVARPPGVETSRYWPTSGDPAHWNYWRREVSAYESGLAATAYRDAGIVAPEPLKIHARADGLVEVWLANVEGSEGFAWSVPRIARFARELGAGQARWAGRVPETAWLSRGFLAQYLAEGPALSVDVRDADWDHPSVRVWPDRLRAGLRRLWTGRERVLAAARSAPRTLCHLDLWPANLIDDAGRSTLLDWSFTGEGAVGEDLANLVVDSFSDGLMDIGLLPEVAQTATDGYLEGLRDGGWSGSDADLRGAVAACGAAKYSWLGPAVLGRAVRDDLGTSSYNSDGSAAESAARLTPLLTLIAEWAETAGS